MIGDKTPVYRGRGCTACGGTGYAGRIGIYEIYRPTNAIRKMINDRASEADLRVAARQAGMKPLREDALAKIRAGITSPDEVLRVVQVDENEVPCPGCKALIEADFTSCPYCRLNLKSNCSGCGQPLRLEWQQCPYCNTNALAQSVAGELDAERDVKPTEPKPATPVADEGQFERRPLVQDEDDSRPAFDLPELGAGEQYLGKDLDVAVEKPVPPPAPAAAPPAAPVEAAVVPVETTTVPAAAPRDAAPPVPAPADPVPPERTVDPLAGRRPLRILVVDDDPDIRLVVNATLRKLDVPVEIVQAEDGVVAMEKVKAARPDLVVLDVMMPRMDGFDTCRALREDVRTAFVPILMLTASADQDSRTKGYLIGTDDYMAKPFLPVDLKLRIARLLRRTYGI
jgi:CheY-like chemotaxis protein